MPGEEFLGTFAINALCRIKHEGLGTDDRQPHLDAPAVSAAMHGHRAVVDVINGPGGIDHESGAKRDVARSNGTLKDITSL